MKYIKEYTEYSFSSTIKGITSFFNRVPVKSEIIRYFNGVKGESKDVKKMYAIIRDRSKGQEISVEDRKFLVKEMFEWLKAGGILIPIYLIPLPIVSEIIILFLDNFLRKVFGFKFLPASFYPDDTKQLAEPAKVEINSDEIEISVKKSLGDTLKENMDILDKIRHYKGNTEDFKKYWKSREAENVELVEEEIVIPVEIGDIILRGRFRNRKVVVKTIGKDEHNGPTINGKKVLTFRLMKQPKKDKKGLITDNKKSKKPIE